MAIFTMVGGKGKGGGDINFEVVGALDKPVNPIENTLWVETEYDVAFWEMDFVKPETAEERTVWIGVSTESNGAFNALKENELMLYPVDCMQFLNGEWVARGLQIYQNGEWVEITPTSFPTGQSICKIGTGALVSILEDGTPVNFYVASLDYEPSLNNASRVLLVRQDVHSSKQLNSSGLNNYKDSTVDAWLNGDYKALFASDVQNLMGETSFKYTVGNGSNALDTLTRSVFLLSATEYGMAASAGVANAEGSALPIANTLRAATFNGSASSKFTRTPNISGDNMNVAIGSNGAYSYTSVNAALGIVPAFTVPKSVLVSPEPNEDGAYELTGISGSAKIYGISRDITASSPEWARTDGAVGFTATASVGTVAGSSSFDNIYPWSEIKRVTLASGDTMVKIPKFYYRRYREGDIEHIKIADKEVEGFTLHPAFNHAGVEKDCIYIGAYETSNNKNSVSGANSEGNKTRSECRTLAKEKGAGWGIYDVSALSAIQMLMLVEFATNDMQTAVGDGVTSGSTYVLTGTCDSVPNLTGRPEGTSNTVDVVWRGIEGLWGNRGDWLDGIIVNGYAKKFYVCNDPKNYRDINPTINNDEYTPYDELSFSHVFGSASGYIKTLGLDKNGNDHVFMPYEGGGSESTFVCDEASFSTSVGDFVVYAGDYTSLKKAGLFSVKTSSNTSKFTIVSSRLMHIPTFVMPTDVTASTTAKDGVTYSEDLSGLSAEYFNLFAAAISNNNAITNETTEIYIDGGDLHCKLSVGSQISLVLNGAMYAFDIIGFNHDDLTDGAAYGKATATGKAGITFQMHDLFATTYVMNSSNTNSSGWKNSAMRTSTMATMKGYLPDGWEAIIKPVNKASGTGGESSSGTETVSDSCFLLAEIEILGSTTYSVSGEGTQYAYYKAGNSKIKNKSGSADAWWTRSPCSVNSNSFCRVYSDGNSYRNTAGLSTGVSFAFCI